MKLSHLHQPVKKQMAGNQLHQQQQKTNISRLNSVEITKQSYSHHSPKTIDHQSVKASQLSKQHQQQHQQHQQQNQTKDTATSVNHVVEETPSATSMASSLGLQQGNFFNARFTTVEVAFFSCI